MDDSEWTEDKLAENEEILMHGVFARFKEQNAGLRVYLKGLEPSGVVNTTVYEALDRFDEELSGRPAAEELQNVVSQIFSDFSVMHEHNVRKYIAGSITGPYGTDTENVTVYGYINFLKDCDAAVQWALFMPDVVKQQQNGFQVETFEYKKLPAMRFIGKETGDRTGADICNELKNIWCFGSLCG